MGSVGVGVEITNFNGCDDSIKHLLTDVFHALSVSTNIHGILFVFPDLYYYQPQTVRAARWGAYRESVSLITGRASIPVRNGVLSWCLGCPRAAAGG